MKNRTTAAAIAAAIVISSTASAGAAAKLITGAQIKNGSITGLDLRNGTVTAADLKNGQVTAAKIRPRSVTSSKLADDSVTTGALDDNAVTSDAIAPSTVTSSDIAPGTIQTTDLAPATAQTLIDAATDAVPAPPVEIAAHAIVDAPSLTVLAGTSKSITGVTRATTGIYCVSAGDVDLSHATATATMDVEYSLPAGVVQVGPGSVQRGEAGSVAIASDTSRCPRTIEVRTFRQISGQMQLDDSVAFAITVA